jgi:glycosyltransferase involved in cell wall biosynthesis
LKLWQGGIVLVSIVTPSLNGIEFLAECIESVQSQSGPAVDVEHILVDGGSTDGTPEFAAAAGCTVLTREERNLTFALNKGIRHAKGALVGFLGCDDVLLPGALDTVVRRYEWDRRPWLIGGCRWLDALGRSKGDQKSPPNWLPSSVLASLDWSPFPAISTFSQRDFLNELGGFDVRFYYAADFDLFVRARSRRPFSRISGTLAGWRRRGDNTSMERNTVHEAEIAAINGRYGPPHARTQKAYRLLTKVVLNGQSPRWLVHKRLELLRAAQSAG